MTILIGILCTDGIVVGADSSATFGPVPGRPTIEQSTKKVFVIDRRFIVAGTGAVGACQRFTAAVEGSWASKNFPKNVTSIEYAKHITKTGIADFVQTDMSKGVFGALVAFGVKRDLALCEFAVSDFQPELKTESMWFSSMGSGQSIADPFLGLMKRVFFPKGQPNVREGLFITTWALQHAIELNPGGINGPPQVATLTHDTKGEPSARILEDDEMEEHRMSVEGAEAHLRDYRILLQSGTSRLPPPPPGSPPGS